MFLGSISDIIYSRLRLQPTPRSPRVASKTKLIFFALKSATAKFGESEESR